jgi:hypothetical protein
LVQTSGEENLEGRKPLGKTKNRREFNITVSASSKKLVVRAWTGFLLLRIGHLMGCCGHGNEPSDSVKYGEFLG